MFLHDINVEIAEDHPALFYNAGDGHGNGGHGGDDVWAAEYWGGGNRGGGTRRHPSGSGSP